MGKIAPQDKCTGCGACAFVCPKSCITMHEQGIKGWLPTIDLSRCIDCGKCTRVCPDKSPIEKHSQIEVYAAWHSNSDMREKCASSGVASAMYQKALNNGWYIGGAVSVNALDVEMQLRCDSDAISEFRSSKYIFSYSDKIYSQIKRTLSEGKKVLFIGLPCQVASIHNLFKSKREQMILVDLVCHGTNAKEFLKQHIEHVASDVKDITKVIFREGKTFLIKMCDEHNQVIYEEASLYRDMYQFGYHKGIFYRDNCYQCQYATAQRISDITLKDYWGLGELAPIDYSKDRVSAVMINSDRGLAFFKECIEENLVVANERPLEEPILGDQMLNHPTLIKPEKLLFDELMSQSGNDFEVSMKKISDQVKKKERRRKILYFLRMKFYILRSKIYHLITD